MKFYLRKSNERGRFAMDWLRSYHSFSFGDYYDAEHMGYRDLRVINHDFIRTSSGFPMHGHRDMEIITYVLKGAVEHQDSIGNKAQTVSGDVQVMTAGRGIRHSEYNPSATEELELLQIWLLPSQGSLDPGYRQQNFSREDKLNKLLLLASTDGRDQSMKINAHADLYAGIVTADKKIEVAEMQKKGYWLQVAKGQMTVNGVELETGDGLAIEEVEKFEFTSGSEAEFLLFGFDQ